ncbi:cell division protein DivIVA [Streptomyces sp. JH14]|uniref:cell division protein DivIVA n=1 Tax=Streptomyces sp. JH14 TaxID=2793630 RepID=UPI0023F7F8CC|nr:cell division protein DivIVA [Streptomyces sp. JH14]MDF6044699.1 cell division protein DivIVA [Streptomyces sp. JH14]
MFWFLLLAMVVVVAAVTLAVVGGGGSHILQDVAPEQLTDPLPANRPVGRADIEAMRLPVVPRGYRMTDVDDALGRLGAELAERDARIAELESALAGAQATAGGGKGLFKAPQDRPPQPGRVPWEPPHPGRPTGSESGPSGSSRGPESGHRPDEEGQR